MTERELSNRVVRVQGELGLWRVVKTDPRWIYLEAELGTRWATLEIPRAEITDIRVARGI